MDWLRDRAKDALAAPFDRGFLNPVLAYPTLLTLLRGCQEIVEPEFRSPMKSIPD